MHFAILPSTPPLLRTVCISVAIAFYASPSHAQKSEPPAAGETAPIVKMYYRKPDPQKFPEEIEVQLSLFFGTLLEGYTKIPDAYEGVLKGTRLIEKPENLKLFVQKTEEMFDLLGRVADFEHYDTQLVGTRMIVITYISWNELYPVQWRFTFYRPKEKWTLIDLIFNTNVEDLVR